MRTISRGRKRGQTFKAEAKTVKPRPRTKTIFKVQISPIILLCNTCTNNKQWLYSRTYVAEIMTRSCYRHLHSNYVLLYLQIVMQNLIQQRFRDASFHYFHTQHYCIHFHEAKRKSLRTGQGQILEAKNKAKDKLLASRPDGLEDSTSLTDRHFTFCK